VSDPHAAESAVLLPFRVALKIATIEEIEAANRGEGRAGADAFLDVAEEIYALHLAFRPAPANVQRWLRHPDERVVLALLKRALGDERFAERSGIHPADFTPVLLERADREGLLWTPLLDEMSRSAHWSAIAETAPAKGRASSAPPHEGHAARLERLVPLVGALIEWEDAERLLGFANPRVREIVAAHCPVIDFERFLEWSKATDMQEHLASNPHLSERQCLLLLRRAWGWRHASSEKALERLAERGVAPTDDLFDDLFRSRLNESGTVKPSSTGRAASDVLRYRNLTPEQVREVARALPDVSAWDWHLVASHPNAPPEVWLEALRLHPSDVTIVSNLARSPRARAHPEVRRYLLGDGWNYIHTPERFRLADVLSEAEMRRLIEISLEERSATRALIAWLESGTLPRTLTQDALLPALQAEEQQVRLAAIRALGGLDAGREERQTPGARAVGRAAEMPEAKGRALR
jgi:hypothetical protein